MTERWRRLTDRAWSYYQHADDLQHRGHQLFLFIQGAALAGFIALVKSNDCRRDLASVRLSSGTLYGILKRLLDDGLVVEARRKTVDDERRRCYRLTPFGREVALAETARLERAAAIARTTGRLGNPLPKRAR